MIDPFLYLLLIFPALIGLWLAYSQLNEKNDKNWDEMNKQFQKELFMSIVMGAVWFFKYTKIRRAKTNFEIMMKKMSSVLKIQLSM